MAEPSANPGTRSPAAEPGPVDWRVLEALRRYQRPGRPDLVARMAGKFLADAERRLPALREAFARADRDALRHCGHALRSASASIGALRLSRLCGAIEDGFAPEDGAALLAHFEREWDLVRAALQPIAAAAPPDPGP